MTSRTPQYPILNLIKDRWSSRAMSSQPLSDQEIRSLFEAARWAPSSYNNQPWRFIIAQRDTPEWNTFLELLYEPNRVWAHRAGILIVVISRTLFFFNDTFSRTHSFDTGAALENLALQGSDMGLVVHGMEGFDYERAKTVLKIPTEYAVEAMFAIGKPAPITVLPEILQSREVPSDRKPVKDLVYKGTFGTSFHEEK